jgi:hypothetical protein
MSLMYRVQPAVSVLVGRPKTDPQIVSPQNFLTNFGLHQSKPESEQALRQCPELVRLAIASHYTWWFLARAHSAVVRTFAHAFMAACKSPCVAICQAYSPEINNGLAGAGIVCNSRGYGNAVYPVMAYRVLHFFGRYLQDAGANGPNANLMQKKDWAAWLRPGMRAYSDHRGTQHDMAVGTVGKVDMDDYDTADREGVLVRSSASRWKAYKHGAITALQPFFSGELVPAGYDMTPFTGFTMFRACEVPKLWIQKPRSKRLVAMIPRCLAYGMEQVGEELPYAVRYVHESDAWNRAVRKQINHYIENREHAAMIAMSKRDSIVAWLNQYDAIATVHYAMPQVEGRNVCMDESNIEFTAAKEVHLQFPGLCENNLG